MGRKLRGLNEKRWHMSEVENYVYINGIRFKDVTGQTVAGKVYTYEEAYHKTLGQTITCSSRGSD